ncbi:MAG: anti-sigma factor, partial [Pseudonocardiales bacterium]|nr:anti-sigma factor [Pseudonocardiales bacterium]
FYEAWAKTAHGLVPIGTFHTGIDVTLWSGVSMADVDAITVSLEQNDGNQETSGQRVMIAQVR